MEALRVVCSSISWLEISDDLYFIYNDFPMADTASQLTLPKALEIAKQTQNGSQESLPYLNWNDADRSPSEALTEAPGPRESRRARIGRPCNSCRIREIECDGERPLCRYCKATDRALAYVEGKETRCRLTQEQLATLEAAFADGYKPNTEYKKTLAEKIGVDFQKVNVSDRSKCVIFRIDLNRRVGFRIAVLKQNIRIHKNGDMMFHRSRMPIKAQQLPSP